MVSLYCLHHLYPITPIIVSGIAAKNKMPTFMPFAALSSKLAAVFLHTAHWAYTLCTLTVKNNINKYLRIYCKGSGKH